jgi:homoserine dehydrogenase
MIKRGAARNKRIKLVASAWKNGGEWILSVCPVEVESGSFLGCCDGWEMGIQIQTDYSQELSMKIMEKEPVSTCAAVVRDIINLSKPVR